jgi:hypothetical protein
MKGIVDSHDMRNTKEQQTWWTQQKKQSNNGWHVCRIESNGHTIENRQRVKRETVPEDWHMTPLLT